MNALVLALAGGIALAIQNLVLSSIVARGLAFPLVLLLNTLVGLTLLLTLNLALAGTAFVGVVGAAWKWWFLLPGLLGTFVMFCMVFGYSTAGAAAPTIGLIAGQVLASLVLDALLIGPGSRQPAPLGIVGAALVALGAILVGLSRR